MKTVFLFAALLLMAASKTFAADVNVHPNVLQSFETTFGKSTNAKWSHVDRLYKAEFEVEGEKTAAFFSADGALVAFSRYMRLTDLSRTLQRSLKSIANASEITEIFEVQNDVGTDYFATVQKADGAVVLKAAVVKWNFFKKG